MTMNLIKENKAVRAKAMRIILILLILSGILLSLLYIPLFPTSSIEKVTTGKITFYDNNSYPLTGTIKISGTKIIGAQRENINSITWSQVPNAVIDFDAFDKIGLAINFRIDEDSPYGRVIIQDHGPDKPANISIPAPGESIKYVEIDSINVNFADSNVTLRFTDDEIATINETDLTLYIFDTIAQDWKELTTWIDTQNNTISATVDVMLVFALGPHIPGIPGYVPDISGKNWTTFKEIITEKLANETPEESNNISESENISYNVSSNIIEIQTYSDNFSAKIDLRDSNDIPIAGHIRTYDKNKNLKTEKKTGILSTTMESGEIEIDALEGKNVMVKLKVNSASDGKIILDDYKKRRPVQIPVPGKVIKYVEIGVNNINFSSAEITIQYSDYELGTVDENTLVIYHWNGGSWDALTTAVDAENNTLSTTASSFSPFAISGSTGGSNQILVATNRYIVQDDPQVSGATATGSGFGLPANDWGTTNNRWTGKQTTIGVKTLYMDANGTPLSGMTINFSLFYPNGSTSGITGTNVTDSQGIASFYSDLDNRRAYGQWRVKAEIGIVSSNTTFIYNWWGCAYASGGCNSEHNGQNPANRGTTTANSPYTASWEMITDERNDHKTDISQNGWADDYCTVCHNGYDGQPTNSTPGTKDFTPPDVHQNLRCDNASCHNPGASFANHNGGTITIGSCNNCHNRTDITKKSTLNGVVSNYSNASSGTIDKYHTPNATIPCIICHGPMHNISKPDNSTRFTKNNVTEDTHCTTCHTGYNKHNSSNTTSGGVNCTLCHSDDVHAIKVFAQNATYVTLNKNDPNSARGNCTNCHQNATFFGILKNTTINPGAGNYSGRDPPQVAVPSKHSNDASAGTKWNQTPGYWTNSDQLTWCKYCHGETNHKSAALGRPSLWDGNNAVNSTIGNTSWCAGCHWQGYASGSNTSSDMVNTFINDSKPVPPEMSGNATNGANISIYEYTNHSLYSKNDSTCNGCHGYGYGFTGITQLMHNQSRVGGPNCVDCHDLPGIVLLSHINVTTTNDTDAIHKNLNSGASIPGNNTPFYSNNKRCWACHGNGSEPSPNAHPSNYKTPYRCPDCHVPSGSQNMNFTPASTLLNVSEHYWNGSDIKTPAISTCYDCHNKSEMLNPANDSDNGSGAVYGGENGGNSSSSHYGKKRTDIRIGASVNCSYCHQNTSTVFASAMANTGNSTILNHSMRYNSSNPACTSSQCHNTGWMHNSTLTKPSLLIPNSTYCFSCHGSNGSGGTNYSGAVTGIKAKHNDTINCTECHLNTSRDIHPVKYLQSSASFGTTNSTGVNCISCHQNTTVFSGLTRTPPKIPNPMYHSDNTSNGTAWNTTGYWTSNSSITSCIYCHNDTKHNSSALGRPALWKGNNVVNGSINTSSWCSSCHYRGYSSGGKNYTDMTLAFISWNLSVPPEITNGTYAPFNLSRYYNHSLTNYSDATCLLCHGTNISSNAGISAFLHNITSGTCTSCHYSFDAMNSTLRPEMFVDSGMYNASLHGSLTCQNCHTQGHKNIGARKACEDCHVVQETPITDKDRHNITATPTTNMNGGTSVVNITDCNTCHNSALLNNSRNTYGYGKPKDCDYCHTYPDKVYR